MNIFDKKLSIVMPAYNEGKNIYNNLLETIKVIGSFHKNFEIIAVNDGSSDNTEQEIKRAEEADLHITSISYFPNRGKGMAIKEGVRKSQGEYIVFLDSDLDISPIHIKSFLEKMEETRVEAVIGSKLHKDSKVNYPKRRKIMSVGYYLVLLLLFRLPVKDTQTGIKLFRADCLKSIIEKIQSLGYTYDIEILANISKMNGKIIEMPIVLIFQRENHWGRIKIRDILAVIKDTYMVYKSVSNGGKY